jgi:hypothetical protein
VEPVDIVLSTRKHREALTARILFWLRRTFQQKMKFGKLIFLVVLALNGGVGVNSQKSFFEKNLAPFFRMGREAFNLFIQPRTFKRGLAENIRNGKVQRQFPNETKFFCDVNGPGGRSRTVPQSVHKLRLGDIDTIGAIGDSLTAGNGAFANDILQVLLEGRGASWSIGGQKTWRNFLTIPNIIKEFNPNLYGYSVADQARTYDKLSRFNVAEPGVIQLMFNNLFLVETHERFFSGNVNGHGSSSQKSRKANEKRPES